MTSEIQLRGNTRQTLPENDKGAVYKINTLISLIMRGICACPGGWCHTHRCMSCKLGGPHVTRRVSLQVTHLFLSIHQFDLVQYGFPGIVSTHNIWFGMFSMRYSCVNTRWRDVILQLPVMRNPHVSMRLVRGFTRDRQKL